MIKLASVSVDYAAPLGEWVPPEQRRTVCFGAAEAIVQQIVNTEQSSEGLFDLLRHSAFEPPLPPNLDLELLARVAAGISQDRPIEHQAVALAFLISIRTYPRARQLGDRLAASREARSYHTVAKLITLLANETDDAGCRELARQLVEECTAFDGPVGRKKWRQHSARLNEIEVRALALRRRGSTDDAFSAIGALAPTATLTSPVPRGRNHLYVGLFGQVRFGDVTLPHVASYLRAQFAQFVRDGGHVSFGIATWCESGQREISEHDSVGFLDPQLPVEIVKIIRELRYQSVGECLSALPNTVGRVITECRNTEQVDEASIRDLFGADIEAVVTPDSAFLTDFATDGERAFGQNMQLFNQGRMWNRISEHSKLVAQAELRTGMPVTHGLLMRTDLLDVSGEIHVLMAKQIADGATNWAYADHDPHAAFIEGLGDRFVLADRFALDRLLDGYKLMRSIIREGTSVDAAYRSRFGAHTLLNTLLFEHDTTIRPVTRDVFNFDLYRGRRNAAMLRKEIHLDAVESPNPYVREQLTALLNAKH